MDPVLTSACAWSSFSTGKLMPHLQASNPAPCPHTHKPCPHHARPPKPCCQYASPLNPALTSASAWSSFSTGMFVQVRCIIVSTQNCRGGEKGEGGQVSIRNSPGTCQECHLSQRGLQQGGGWTEGQFEVIALLLSCSLRPQACSTAVTVAACQNYATKQSLFGL